MKYRTFFTTLLLFLITFNLGILIISFAMFKDTVKHAEERSLADHYIITSSVVKDFNAVESRGIHIEGAIDSLLQQYNNFSGDQKVGLALYKNDQFVYSNRQENVWKSRLTEATG